MHNSSRALRLNAHLDVLNALIVTGAITSITLTFFHPTMWLLVAFFLGVTTLRVIEALLSGTRREPAIALMVLIWILWSLVVATAYGATHGFYNSRQIAFVLFGLVLGYWISIVRAPTWLAWMPFMIFAAYFLTIIAAGRDPGEALTRNSRNFVSVILMALYVSAILLSKPPTVRPFHLAMAFIVLLVSFWSTGRGGIVTSLLLTCGLFGNMLLRGRTGIVRALSITATLFAAAALAYVGAEIAQSQGYLNRLAQRGLTDAPRLAMIIAYFKDIQLTELIFGRDYYNISYLARFDFNLHNSYLSAWAHLGLPYFLLILFVLAVSAIRLISYPVLVLSFFPFAIRAFTDTQMLVAKYDYVFIATLFILLRTYRRTPLVHRATALRLS